MHFAPEPVRSGEQPKVAYQRVDVVRRAPKSEVRFTLLYKRGMSAGLRMGLARAPRWVAKRFPRPFLKVSLT